MPNQQLAKILSDIALYLEMDNVAFKPQAYEKAALVLETLSEDVAEIYKQKGLKGMEDIPGVGVSIAEKIEEFLKTGRIRYYEQLKKKMPVDIEGLTSVEGLGPKMVKALYQELKIRNLADLEKAAEAGKIRNLPRFGLKTEQNILQGLQFLKRSKGRFALGKIYPIAQEIYQKLEGLKEVAAISFGGSLRRMKETIGDVDLLVCIKESKGPASAKASTCTKVSADKSAGKIMDFFVSQPGVVKVWDKGPTKSSVRMEDGFDMDIRVIPKKSYGAALQYFTGSKEHNIALRKIAIDKGFKLNEYGLFKGKKMLASRTEKDIYDALGMALMPPEIRENQGEIELSLRQGLRLSSAECPQGELSRLPKLIGYSDVKGDLHCHSDWDGGANTIEEMALSAREMGYQYIGISDHTKFLRIENGLDEKQLSAQRREIDKLNSQYRHIKISPFRVLQGCEANIMSDGSIDISDEAMAKLDYVIAGVHSQMKMPRAQMTARIIRAMKNPNVDILSHPTGRLLGKRDEYQIDFDKILAAAKEFKVALEINGSPWRMDLKDSNIRRAKEAGVKMVINTDSHQKDHLAFMKYGISQARRGWAACQDIINTYPLEKLKTFFH